MEGAQIWEFRVLGGREGVVALGFEGLERKGFRIQATRVYVFRAGSTCVPYSKIDTVCCDRVPTHPGKTNSWPQGSSLLASLKHTFLYRKKPFGAEVVWGLRLNFPNKHASKVYG